MNRIQNQCFAATVCKFYEDCGKDHVKTCHHFDRYKRRQTSKYRPILGRPRNILTERNLKKIDRQITKNPRISQRIQAMKVDISRTSIQRAKKELGFRTFTRKKAPKYIDNQQARCKNCARKLYEAMCAGKKVIMDHETYCPIDPDQIPGKEYFAAR